MRLLAPPPAGEAGRRAGFPSRVGLSRQAAWGEAGHRANQGTSRSSAEQLATVVATFFESCVSREILGGDRAGPWLEVFAQVVSAGEAGVGGRAGRGTKVAGAAAGRSPAELCSDGARRRGAGGGGCCGTLSDLPPPPSLQKSLPLPCLGFPFLKCRHQLACLSRDNRSICQSSSETKVRGTSRGWLLLIRGGGRARFRPFRGSLLLGKVVTPRPGRRWVTSIVGSASAWSPQQAPSLSTP